MTVTPDLADRLAKILGMLGSTHDGEIAAAGRAAVALIKSAGLTWPDVVGAKGGSREGWPPLPPRHADDEIYRRTHFVIGALPGGPDGITAAGFDDLKFCTKLMSLHRRRRPIAQKDLDRLDGMFTRYGGKQKI